MSAKHQRDGRATLDERNLLKIRASVYRGEKQYVSGTSTNTAGSAGSMEIPDRKSVRDRDIVKAQLQGSAMHRGEGDDEEVPKYRPTFSSVLKHDL